MKTLLASIALLSISLSLCAQVDQEYVVLKGFHQSEHKSKSETPSELLRSYNFSENHELRKTDLGENRFQHYYSGIPVKYSSVTLNPFGFGGNLYQFDKMHGAYKLTPLQISERLSLANSNGNFGYGDIAQVIIPQNEVMIPAYEIPVYHRDIAKSHIVYLSGITGEQISQEPLAIPFGQPVFARSMYDGTVIMEAHRDSTGYSLSHDVLNHRTFDLSTSVDMDSISEISGDNSIFVQDKDAVQAHYALGMTLDYFALRHGRESYDDQGAIVQSYINYGDNSNLAFWSQGNIVLGGGDGVYYGDMSAIDIVGHEFSHGIIDHTADLRYFGESGAINESFADILGEMTEYFAHGKCNWEAGSQVGLSSRVRFRSFNNPKGMDLPDTYQGEYWINTDCGTPTGINDYCGVHTNSSIQNKWFYLLANGGEGTNDNDNSYEVLGISANAAATIAYKNLTEYLWSTAGFHDAREGSILAAKELYGAGSIQEISTTNAWYAVGVGAAYIDETIVEDTIAHITIAVEQVTDSSISISWQEPIVDIDSLYFTIDLNHDYYTNIRDTAISISGLTEDSTYYISVSGYRDTSLIALSDTISVITLTKEVPNDTLASFYYEEGLDGWEVNHDDAQWYQGRRSPEGDGSIRLRDDENNNKVKSPWVALNGYGAVDVSFTIYAWSVEYGEQLIVEYSTQEGSWSTLANLVGRSDFHNYLNQSYTYDGIELSGDSIQFRVSLNASANSDHIYFDEFILTGTQVLPLFKQQITSEVHIWPNPTTEIVHMSDGVGYSDINVYDSAGRIIYRSDLARQVHSIRTSALPAGVYYVEFIGADSSVSKSFTVK